MAQHVGAHLVPKPCQLRVVVNDEERGLPIEASSPGRHEERFCVGSIARCFCHECGTPGHTEIRAHRRHRASPDRHDAFFCSLAKAAQHPIIEANVAQRKTDELGNSQTARVEHFKDGAVAQSAGVARVNGVQELFHVGLTQCLRQPGGHARRLDVSCRVVRRSPLVLAKIVQAADRDERASARGRLEPTGTQKRQVFLDRRRVDIAQSAVVDHQELLITEQVPSIRFDGISCAAALDRKVGEVLLCITTQDDLGVNACSTRGFQEAMPR